MNAVPSATVRGTDLTGKIPAHWNRLRLGALLDERKEIVGDRADSTKLLSLTLRGVIPRDMDNRVGKIPASFETYQIVKPGDIVFCLFDVDETPRTVGLASEPGMVTGAYTVMKPRPGVDPRFLSYHYLSFDQSKSLRFLYAGLRNTIRSSDFKNIHFSVPPYLEQQQIADYLDHETAEIDMFLSDLEALSRLNSERQQAYLDRTLARFKKVSDQLIPLKYCVRPNPTPRGHGRALPEKVTYLPMSAIGTFGPVDATLKRPVNEMLSGYSFVTDGDIAVAKVTPCFENGKGAVFSGLPDGVAFATTEVAVFRPTANLTADYLATVFRSSIFVLGGESAMTGAGGLRRVPDSYFLNYTVPVLSTDAQKQITSEVMRMDTISNELRHSVTQAINLARERRAALITAAVTGQIDVTARNKPAAEQLEDDIAQGLHREYA